MKFFVPILAIFCISCSNLNSKETKKSESVIDSSSNLSIKYNHHSTEVSYEPSVKDTTRYVYLTIDDGPSPFSRDILEISNTESTKMTVFLVGNNMWSKKYQQYLAEYRNSALIDLGNHSYSHAKGRYSHYYHDPNAVLLDFYKNIAEMQLPNSLARLPGRSFWSLGNKENINQESGRKAARLLKEKGFLLFGWDVEWFYDHNTGAPLGTAEKVFHEIQFSLRNNLTFEKSHCVVLLHERHFVQKREVSKLIELCKKAGFKFEHLKNYPVSKSPELTRREIMPKSS
ncbi:MAG: polysaccharide deacetylase family protein [Saprospiraceae bacterium]